MTLRAAIYARVSSAAQRDAHTIDGQLQALRPYVAARGWALVGTFLDDGRSAKTGALGKRDGFAALLDLATSGRLDVLVTSAMDRLTRTEDLLELAEILGPFQRAGIQIVSPSSGDLDLRTMHGMMAALFQSQAAASENARRAERVRQGKARAIAEGRKPAGPTPYGLAYSRALGLWSIDPERAAIVREIFARVIGGEACRTIANDLEDRGVPRPRGAWSGERVWAIARSRHVLGEWIADKRTHAVIRVPEIIDEATWQAAQTKLVEHGKRGLRRTRHVYLLEGIATCGLCGSPIAIRSPTPQRYGRVGPPAYVCRARKLPLRGRGRCPSPILPVADVDARIWEVVSRALVSPVLVEAVARRLAARAADQRDWAADVRSYESRIAQAERAEAAILARFRRGSISEGALDVELAAAGRARTGLAAQLDAARAAVTAHHVPQDSAEEIVGALRQLAASASIEARQRVVRALVPWGGAVLAGQDVEIVLEISEPGEAVSLVRSAGYRTPHGDSVRLRIVA